MPTAELAGAASLRRHLAAHRPSRSSEGYPMAAREVAAAWARPLHASGHGWSKLASAVGISRNTLRSWCAVGAPEVASGAWLPVTVAEPPPPAASTVVLVTPSGFRVENLDPDLLMRILRELA